MANNLDSFFADKFEHESTFKSDKILCILEGGDELSFVKRVYEVYNGSIECQNFVVHKIKLSYGQGIVEWQGNTVELRKKSKEKCNFQGGDTKEKAPLPILASLNNEDLEIYKAIIVMFDKDRDIDDRVEKESIEILKKYSNQILFLSNPCFEKESITFFKNRDILEFIHDNYSTIDGSTCRWYKSNYGKLLQFNPIGNKKKLSTVIPILEKKHFESEEIDVNMQKLIDFIRTNLC